MILVPVFLACVGVLLAIAFGGEPPAPPCASRTFLARELPPLKLPVVESVTA